MCVFSSHSFWKSSLLDVPAGVTQEEGHTGFLIHLPAVRAFIFTFPLQVLLSYKAFKHTYIRIRTMTYRQKRFPWVCTVHHQVHYYYDITAHVHQLLKRVRLRRTYIYRLQSVAKKRRKKREYYYYYCL